MRMFVNLQDLMLDNCPLIKAMPGLSDLVALSVLHSDCGAFEGFHDLRKLIKLEAVLVQGWNCQGLPCLSDLVNLKSFVIRDAEGVDELTGLLNLPRLQELEIVSCGFKDVPCLSNLTALASLEILDCDKLEGLPQMHGLSRLEKLAIKYCDSMREWNIGRRLRLFGTELINSETLLQLLTLVLAGVAFTELPDLSSFPQLKILKLLDCQELTKLTNIVPLTALQSLKLCQCRNLRALPDLRHLVSLRYLRLKDCGELQLTAHEIENLEKMSPGLEVEFDGLLDVNYESEDGCDDERAEKRLKLVEDISLGLNENQNLCW